MKPSEMIQELYDSEITVRVEPDGCWDGGFRAQIGDDQNGWEEPIFRAHKFDDLMMKVAEHVIEKYPDSRFARRYARGLMVEAV